MQMLDAQFFVFPARAGMIPPGGFHVQHPGGIPRESGDDPLVKIAGFCAAVYSPRERG